VQAWFGFTFAVLHSVSEYLGGACAPALHIRKLEFTTTQVGAL